MKMHKDELSRICHIYIYGRIHIRSKIIEDKQRCSITMNKQIACH